MAEIPQEWAAFAQLQNKLSLTHSVPIGAALEDALNVVHEPDFQPETLSAGALITRAATAARRERHRTAVRRTASISQLVPEASSNEEPAWEIPASASVFDEVSARRDLARLSCRVDAQDWHLLVDVAVGETYDALALEYAATASALRTRVCRLRQRLARSWTCS
jgi:hypothetical protein